MYKMKLENLMEYYILELNDKTFLNKYDSPKLLKYLTDYGLFEKDYNDRINRFNSVGWPFIILNEDYNIPVKESMNSITSYYMEFAFYRNYIQVYRWYNTNTAYTFEYDRVYFDPENDKYFYIGYLVNDLIITDHKYAEVEIGFDYNKIRDVLCSKASPGDRIIINKISTSHLGGPKWSYENGWDLDCLYYDNIRDKLAKLSGKEYYDYCMRLIEYEVTILDSFGNNIITYWELEGDSPTKSEKDFLNPATFKRIMRHPYPILWDRTKHYEWED